MDLLWSPDESIASTQRDHSGSGLSTAVQGLTERERPSQPSRLNKLFTIDDSDFEALIEILGTDGEGNRDKGRDRNDAPPTHSTEQRVAHDKTALSVARSPERAGPSTSKSKPAGSPSKASSRPMKPKAPKAPKEPAKPHDSAIFGPASRPAVEQVSHSGPVPGTSISGLSRTSERPILGENNRVATGAGVTQLNARLETSVAEANNRVSDLRNRIQLLKDEVKEAAPHLYRRAFDGQDTFTQRDSYEDGLPPENKKQTNGKGKGRAIPPSYPVNGNLPRSELELISALSEDEAKGALGNICRRLHIDPSDLVSSSAQMQDGDLPVPPTSISDIVRALRLVVDIDKLVWRNTDRRDQRSGFSDNRTEYNIYEGENIQAIVDRVRLWERTARSRVGRRLGG